MGRPSEGVRRRGLRVTSFELGRGDHVEGPEMIISVLAVQACRSIKCGDLFEGLDPLDGDRQSG